MKRRWLLSSFLALPALGYADDPACPYTDCSTLSPPTEAAAPVAACPSTSCDRFNLPPVHVCKTCTWSSIQQGVDHAVAGQNVVVHDGVYTENVVIPKRVCLKVQADALPPPLYPVRIYSPSDAPAITIIGGNAAYACVEGFHIVPQVLTNNTAAIFTRDVGNVFIARNLIDLSFNPTGAGVFIGGFLSTVAGNTLIGSGAGNGTGITVSSFFGGAQYADVISANRISSFPIGINLSGSNLAVLRVIGNTLNRTAVGVSTHGSLQIARNVYSDNVIANPLSIPNFCGPDSTASSCGFYFYDVHGNYLLRNRVEGVEMGVHFDYDTCGYLLQDNHVSATREAIHVCNKSTNHSFVNNQIETARDGSGTRGLTCEIKNATDERQKGCGHYQGGGCCVYGGAIHTNDCGMESLPADAIRLGPGLTNNTADTCRHTCCLGGTCVELSAESCQNQGGTPAACVLGSGC